MILVLSRFAFAFALALPLSFDAIFPPLVNNDELLPLLLPPLPFEIRMQLVATIRWLCLRDVSFLVERSCAVRKRYLLLKCQGAANQIRICLY